MKTLAAILAILGFLVLAPLAWGEGTPPPPYMPPVSPQADAPDWIAAPSLSNTGDVTVSWDASTTAGATYVLTQATKADFSDGQVVYNQSATQYTAANLAAGSYHFRVYASVPLYMPSAAVTPGHPTCVDTTVPDPPSGPAAPAGLTVPSSAGAPFPVSWTRITGNVGYRLEREYMANYPMGVPPPGGWTPTSTFSYVYEGYNDQYVEGPIDCDMSWFKYRVRAYVLFHGYKIYGSWSAWSGTCQVANAPPGYCHTVSATGSTSGGTVSVMWAAAWGAASYEVEEDCDPNFSNPTLVDPLAGGSPSPTGYNGGTLSGRTDGTYFYRVRALNAYGTSRWVSTTLGAVVTGNPGALPPSTPAWIDVPAAAGSNPYTVTWAGVPGATSYVVEEDTSPDFDDPVEVGYSFPGYNYLYVSRGNLPDATYYYRVKAVNTVGASDWREGANGCVVASTATMLTLAKSAESPGFIDVRNAAEDTVVLVFTVAAKADGAVRVDGIALAATGTGDDCADVAYLGLYRDEDGDGKLTPGVDTFLKGTGSFDADEGKAAFSNVNATVAAGVTETWLVVVDLAGTAAGGDTFRFQIPYAPSVEAVDAGNGAPVYVGGAPVQCAQITVLGDDTPGALTVTKAANSPANATVQAGALGVVMGVLDFEASLVEDLTVVRVEFHGLGTGDESADLAAVYLAEDGNGDGAYTPGVDRLVAAGGAYDGDNGTVAFSSLTETVAAGSTCTYLLVYDMADEVEGDLTFTAEIPTVPSVEAWGVLSGIQVAVAADVPLAGRTITTEAGDEGGDEPGPGCMPAALSGVESAGVILPFLFLAGSLLALRRRRP